jgi:hypothetical protein
MKFAVAIRLIQCEQNGISVASLQQQQQVSSDLQQGLPPNLRPVFFEGIPIPPAAASSSSTAAGEGGPPRPPVPTTPFTAAATAMVPPPTRHQQYGDADGVSVGGGGGGSVAPSVAGSVATMPPPQYQLTVQDPYSITPTEQGRYEQIFPDYTTRLDLHINIHHECICYHNILMRMLEALQDPLKRCCHGSGPSSSLICWKLQWCRSFGSIRSIAAILNK